MAITIPQNVKDIPRHLEAIQNTGIGNNKPLANDSRNALQEEYEAIEGQLAAFDQNDLTSIPIHPNITPDEAGGLVQSLITDGGDAFSNASRTDAENSFNEIKEKLIKKLDGATQDLKNTSIKDNIMSQASKIAGPTLLAGGVDNVDPNKLMSKIKQTQEKDDIKLLMSSFEKISDDSKVDLYSTGQNMMGEVNIKTQDYSTIAGSFTGKMSGLNSDVFPMNIDRLTAGDLNVDSALDQFESIAGKEIMNMALQAGLVAVGVPPIIAQNITVDDVKLVAEVVQGKVDIQDAAGNIALNKIDGMVPAQDASKIAKAMRNQIESSDTIISNNPEINKIVSGNENVAQAINDGKDFLKTV